MPDAPRPDFEARYRQETPPWDIGRPQREVVRLEEAGLIVGPILDVGCGTGENALYLAARGHPAMGIDGAPTAIARAREKAAARALAAEFHVWDALQLGRLRKRFETVIDCGLFHVLTDEERRPYAAALAEVTAPGSDVFLLCFSDAEPPGPGPRRVADWELRDAFRSIFVVRDLSAVRLENRLSPEGARGWLARLTRI